MDFPDLATVFATGDIRGKIGAEMKQERHYANVITLLCSFITHRDNSSHPETIQSN